jgi:hypothetical protein
METVFTGLSGFSYLPYMAADLAAPWNPVPGNYAFIRLKNTLTGSFDILYFGECASFSARPMPPGHDRWDDAVKLYGATHVLCHVNLAEEWVRKEEERDLIAAYNPPMNVQHRTGIAGALGLGALSGLGLINRSGNR